jgi:hypothetical protein
MTTPVLTNDAHTGEFAAFVLASDALRTSEAEVRASEEAARIANEQLRLVTDKHAVEVQKGTSPLCFNVDCTKGGIITPGVPIFSNHCLFVVHSVLGSQTSCAHWKDDLEGQLTAARTAELQIQANVSKIQGQFAGLREEMATTRTEERQIATKIKALEKWLDWLINHGSEVTTGEPATGASATVSTTTDGIVSTTDAPATPTTVGTVSTTDAPVAPTTDAPATPTHDGTVSTTTVGTSSICAPVKLYKQCPSR